MSEVFIPLGGAGGKNRGSQYKIPENAQTIEMFGSVFVPLPPGVYKKYVLPNGQPALPSADGGDAVVSMSKEFLKKQAIKTFGIASITNFSLTMYAHRQVRLTWAKPDRGLFSGIHFVFKYGSMPTNENDGFMVYDSADVHYETARLEERELFVRAYSYVTVTDGRWYDEGKVSAKITVTGISGSITLSTGAGTWTVPDKVDKIRYIVVGQGGLGGDNGNLGYGGGGGAGGYFATGYMNVSPGQSITYNIPSTPFDSTMNFTGNRDDWPIYYRGGHIGALDTWFGELSVQHGGSAYIEAKGFYNDWYVAGGNGGSGGGGGNGGVGGTNGGNGGNGADGSYGYGRASTYSKPGTGAGVSTLGFNGVMYCSGGNGGVQLSGESKGSRGTDGLGNGGSGADGKPRYGTTPHVAPKYGGTGCIYIAWGSLMNDGT
nr:MAG TPA: hypothetical protein [Caudoviricetes sp.]